MERIKYFPRSDMAVGHYLKVALELLRRYKGSSVSSINQALELYNVIKYYNDGVLTLYCNDNAFYEVESVIDHIKKDIGKYIGRVKKLNSKSTQACRRRV